MTDLAPTSPPPAAPSGRWDLAEVVAELRRSRDVTHNIRPPGRIPRPPSREALEGLVKDFTAVLFPRHYGQGDLDEDRLDDFVARTLEAALERLAEQAARSFAFSRAPDQAAEEEESPETLAAAGEALARAFAAQTPQIRGLLVSDLRAAYKGDPAATNFPEILLSYPGVSAILHHRFAHALHRLGATLLARLVSDIGRARTGVDIHPGATIGASFFIDHGAGVVIGETAVIGERVRIYQGVTLGARSFPTDAAGFLIKGAARHPIVEDDVVIYAGATVLGRVTIGRGATVGGHAWLTRSLPAGTHFSAPNPAQER